MESSTESAPSTPATPPQILDKAAIMAREDRVFELVDVPEWGGAVRVRGLTAGEWDAVENSMVVTKGKSQSVTYADFRAKLVARGCVDAAGARLFTDEDTTALSAKSAAAIGRLAEAITRLSKKSDEDVEELVGNSSGGPTADSSST